MDKLSSVGVFVRAAETRNFSEAGRQLGSSSSAVGKAISRLEERLGVRLFYRSTRSVTLTSEGQMFLARCLRVLGELQAAEIELSAGQAPRGLLRISLPIASTLFAPVLGSFMREYPDVRLDLDFTDRIVDVIEGGFDVVLRTGDAGDSRLVSRVLGYYSPRLVASPRYLQSRGSPTVVGDLVRHDCLVHRFPATGKVDPWLLVERGMPVEVALNVLVTASSVEPLVDMVTQGLGIAYLPDFLVEGLVKSGQLVEVLSGRVLDRKVFRALWPSGRSLSPKVRAFVDYLARSLLPSSLEVPGTIQG